MTDQNAVPTAPQPPPGRHLLEGKGVVITAAAGTGIGSALAERCQLEGARLVISDLHERRLGETADRLAELGPRPTTILCNVTDEEQVQHLVQGSIEALGGIDVWMNNAGLGGNAPIVEMTDEQWSMVLDVTLTGTLAAINTALNGITYTPSATFGGNNESLTITINDQGNTGAVNNPLSDSESVTIIVDTSTRPRARNDAKTVVEDSSLPATSWKNSIDTTSLVICRTR